MMFNIFSNVYLPSVSLLCEVSVQILCSLYFFFFWPLSMWDPSSLMRNGTHVLLHWKCRVLTTGPSGKSPPFVHFKIGFFAFLQSFKSSLHIWNTSPLLESVLQRHFPCTFTLLTVFHRAEVFNFNKVQLNFFFHGSSFGVVSKNSVPNKSPSFSPVTFQNF